MRLSLALAFLRRRVDFGPCPPLPFPDAMMGVSGKSFRPAAGGHGGSQQGHVTDVDSGALVINTSSEPSAVRTSVVSPVV